MKRKFSNFCNDQNGSLLIELALVVGILAMTAMGGLEIAHFLKRSQNGVTLTRELGNTILRDCFDACDASRPQQADSPTGMCINRQVRRVARIARGIDPAMNIRATVLVRNVDAECIFQTSPTWKTFSGSSSTSAFQSPRAIVSRNLLNNIRNASMPQQQGIVVLAEVEARYSSLTGFALNIFGRDSFYYQGTIM